MTTNLKPCPFCGNTEPRSIVTDIGPGYQTSLVRCRHCPAELGKSGLDAADYWNRRPTAWRSCKDDPPPMGGNVLVRYPKGTNVPFMWYHYQPASANADYEWCEVPE